MGFRSWLQKSIAVGAASALTTLRLRCNKFQLVDANTVDSLSLLLSADTCRVAWLDLGANELRDEVTVPPREARCSAF